MIYTFEQVDGVLNSVQEQQPEIKEIILFYKEIFKTQLPFKNNPPLPPEGDNGRKIQEQVKQGIPWLEFNLIPDFLQTSTLLGKELSKLIKKRGPAVALKMETLEEQLLKDDDTFLSLSRSYLSHDRQPLYDFAEAHNLDSNLLFFFIKNSIKPFIESLAEKISPICDFSPWAEAFCPICGSLPALAYLKPIKTKENGHSLITRGKQRLLTCSLCHHRWKFPRLKCPFCQIDKQESLRYFSIDSGQKQYRVDVCNDCRGYIKTIDLEFRSTAEELLFLEDLNTLQLDWLAEKEGYCKKAEGIFS